MASLADLYKEVHNSKLYRHGEGYAQQFQMPRIKPDKDYKTNAALAKEWSCTARHASKARRGAEAIICKSDACGCPISQKRSAKKKGTRS